LLDIISHRQGDTLIVSIKGELDHHTAEIARDRLDSLLEDKSLKNMVVDLSHLKFMDSSGIGVFIGRYKKLSERMGKLGAYGLNNHIRKIWEISGLHRIIDIYDNLEESLNGIQEV